jgi:membrane fusion protein (multidrug efflux system)
VPVRVALDPRQLSAHPLRIGLSTRATVDIRETSGPQLAQAPRTEPVLNTDIYVVDFSEITARIAQIIADNAPLDSGGTASKVGPAHGRIAPKVSKVAARPTSNGSL